MRVAEEVDPLAAVRVGSLLRLNDVTVAPDVTLLLIGDVRGMTFKDVIVVTFNDVTVLPFKYVKAVTSADDVVRHITQFMTYSSLSSRFNFFFF